MKQIEQSTILTHNYEGHEIRSMLKDGNIYIAQSDLLAAFGHETLFSNENVITDLLVALGNSSVESHEKAAAIANYLHEQGLISSDAARKVFAETSPFVAAFTWKKNHKEESHND